MSYTDNSLVARLKRAWSAFCCQGDPIFAGKVLLSTLNRQSARRGDIGTADSPAPLGWKCVKRFENCEACPRFKAYWQGLAAGRSMAVDIHPLPSFEQDESNVGDGDGKAAEIEHINEHQIGAVIVFPGGHSYPYLDPVLTPASPSIKETERRSKQGNSERDRLDEILVHGGPKHSSGHALNWVLASIAAIILSSGYLLGGPDDIATAIAQAEALQELESAMDSRPDLLEALKDATPGTAQHLSAATDFCQHTKGPTALLTPLADGALACRVKPPVLAAQSI